MITEFVNFRRQYLSNAVLQAKNASNTDSLAGSAKGALDRGLLDLLEGKLAVLQFQIKIKEELEAIASRMELSAGASESVENGSVPNTSVTADASLVKAAEEKAKELSLDLKSITQLYNEYAVPFELWEVFSYFLFSAQNIGVTFVVHLFGKKNEMLSLTCMFNPDWMPNLQINYQALDRWSTIAINGSMVRKGGDSKV